MRKRTVVRLWLVLFTCGMNMACCGVVCAQARSMGTAFAVTSDGIYATCAHLVKDKGEIRLTSTYAAKVIAMDEDNDLALLRASRKVFKDFGQS